MNYLQGMSKKLLIFHKIKNQISVNTEDKLKMEIAQILLKIGKPAKSKHKTPFVLS